MATTTAPAPWVEVARERAQAEFAELAWLLTEYATGVAAIDEPASWHGRSEEMGVAMDLALATGYSEHQVRRRLSVMRTVRDLLPTTWLSFRAGDIDAARTTQLAYAAGHNAAELRRWIIRFCARVEPDQTNEASEKARGLRHVRVHHDGDGMAWLNAFIPSAVAAAADRRLKQAARVLTDEPDEPRSLQHKRADLLGAWLTHGDETISTPTVNMDVAVVVPVEALAGHTDLPAASYDHSWTMPADWLTALADTGTGTASSPIPPAGSSTIPISAGSPPTSSPPPSPSATRSAPPPDAPPRHDNARRTTSNRTPTVRPPGGTSTTSARAITA